MVSALVSPALRLMCLLAIAMIAAPVARAQGVAAGAGYCGQVTWEGEEPEDTWVIFLPNDRYQMPLSIGALREAPVGAISAAGDHLTMRSDGAPHFVADMMMADGGFVGAISNDRGEHGTIRLSPMRGSGGALRSSPLPPGFAPDYARTALAGEWDDLRFFAAWPWAPQGTRYWLDIYRAGPPLPADARAAIEDWLRRAAAGEQARCSE